MRTFYSIYQKRLDNILLFCECGKTGLSTWPVASSIFLREDLNINFDMKCYLCKKVLFEKKQLKAMLSCFMLNGLQGAISLLESMEIFHISEAGRYYRGNGMVSPLV